MSFIQDTETLVEHERLTWDLTLQNLTRISNSNWFSLSSSDVAMENCQFNENFMTERMNEKLRISIRVRFVLSWNAKSQHRRRLANLVFWRSERQIGVCGPGAHRGHSWRPTSSSRQQTVYTIVWNCWRLFTSIIRDLQLRWWAAKHRAVPSPSDTSAVSLSYLVDASDIPANPFHKSVSRVRTMTTTTLDCDPFLGW